MAKESTSTTVVCSDVCFKDSAEKINILKTLNQHGIEKVVSI